MSNDQRRLAAALFAVAWGTNISTPLILRYQDRQDLSDSAAVAIFSVYVGGILLALLFAGRLSDRFGRRPIVLPFTLLSGVGSLLMIAGRDEFAYLLAGRFLLGLVSGATISVGTAWMNELVTPSESDQANDATTASADRLRLAGVVTLLLYLGFGFGPITSALSDRWLPHPLVSPYFVHAAACAISAAVVWPAPETKSCDPDVALRPSIGVPAGARREFLSRLAPSSVWVFGFPSVSFALFPVILRDAIGGSDVLVAGVSGSVTAVAALAARPIVRRSATANQALLIGMVIGVGGYVVGVVAFTTGAWWLVPGAAVALGAASGVLLNAGLAITEGLADDEQRGTLSATYYLLAYSGMAMPLLLTGVSSLTTTTTALVSVTIVATVVAILVALQLGAAQRITSSG